MNLFLATLWTVIDVSAGRISFQLCGDNVNFYFSPPIVVLVPVAMVSVASAVISMIGVFEEDGVPDIWYYTPFDLALSILTCFESTIVHSGVVMDSPLFIVSVILPSSFFPPFTV